MSDQELNYVSSDGKRRYASWEDLVAGEANGWVATAILRERARRQSLFTYTVGPFPTEREAKNARVRMRTRWRREDRDDRGVMSDIVAVTVRPAWKDTK